MMNKPRFWAGPTVLVLLLAAAAVAQVLKVGPGVFKPGSEPDGFRSLRWGQDISRAPDLKDLEPVQVSGAAVFYRKKGDDLTLGLAKLDEITYRFLNGKFFKVYLRVTGHHNFLKLEDYCFARFGAGGRTEAHEKLGVPDYIWQGFKSAMTLRYNEITRTGEMELFSLTYERSRLKEFQ